MLLETYSSRDRCSDFDFFTVSAFCFLSHDNYSVIGRVPESQEMLWSTKPCLSWWCLQSCLSLHGDGCEGLAPRFHRSVRTGAFSVVISHSLWLAGTPQVWRSMDFRPSARSAAEMTRPSVSILCSSWLSLRVMCLSACRFEDIWRTESFTPLQGPKGEVPVFVAMQLEFLQTCAHFVALSPAVSVLPRWRSDQILKIWCTRAKQSSQRDQRLQNQGPPGWALFLTRNDKNEPLKNVNFCLESTGEQPSNVWFSWGHGAFSGCDYCLGN